MKRHSVLLLIIIFGLLVRFNHLDQIPSGFFSDEAAAGYDAYSILKTARDLHGEFLPLSINRFDMAIETSVIYVYLSVIPIALFGLSIFSVRLMAAFVGTLTILTTYLFVNEFFDRKTALLAALLIALSPHHLIFSRWAHEGILVPFFITLGLFLILRAFKTPLLLIPASAFLGLSFYTYPIVKVFVPLVIILICAFYYRELFRLFISKDSREVKICIISVTVFFLLAAFPYYNDFSRGGNLRFASISIFHSADPIGQFFSNMMSHLSPVFLFFRGDSDFRHNVPGFGEVFPVLIPFILLALGVSAYKKKKEIFLLFCLFIAGLIPASLTNQGIPHALRTLSAVPFLEIIAAYGILVFYEYLKGKKASLRVPAMVFVLVIVSAQIAFFLYIYFTKYPAISEHWFQYGLKEAIEYAEKRADNYNKVILSGHVREGDVLLLFYTRRDPAEFQKTGKIGKYFICATEVEGCYSTKGRNLFIVFPDELPDKNVKESIFYSSGDIAYKIVE